MARRRDLSQAEQAALWWFFCEGLAAFEGSTFGAMIERASLLALRQVGSRCRACAKSPDPGINADGSDCETCFGTGRVQSRIERAWRDPEAQEMPVNETASGGGGHTPNDEAITRYAVISRRLAYLPRLDVEALGLLFGPAGERCAELPGWRMIALYGLTKAGRKLAEMGGNSGPVYDRAWQEATKPGKLRQRLVAEAEAEAQEIYFAAVARWASLRTHEARRVYQRPGDHGDLQRHAQSSQK